MDIRTKLVIALVAVSLTSMWILGFFANQTAAALMQEISVRQLDALAESKANDVDNIIASWRDRTSLIASRTQLRINLRGYNASESPALLVAMQRILNDAKNSTPSVTTIELENLAGKVIATAGDAAYIARAKQPGEGVQYAGLQTVADQSYVTFSAPLVLDGAVIGRVNVALNCQDLGIITNDYTGLGELGETLIAYQQPSGEVLTLQPLRHAPPEQRVLPAAATFPQAALRGEETTYSGSDLDYRGAEAWAATRHIDALQWGLVVKLDKYEEQRSVRKLRSAMIDLALSLSAFAIFGGTLLGMYLARPIRRLAELVDRIREGDVTLRAPIESEDEIGQLSAALNEFLDHRKDA